MKRVKAVSFIILTLAGLLVIVFVHWFKNGLYIYKLTINQLSQRLSCQTISDNLLKNCSFEEHTGRADDGQPDDFTGWTRRVIKDSLVESSKQSLDGQTALKLGYVLLSSWLQ